MLTKKRASKNLTHAWLRRLFGNPDVESGTYFKGTVDEESLKAMLEHAQNFERSAENQPCLKWPLE